MQYTGFLPEKNHPTVVDGLVHYRVGDVDFNAAIGQQISLTFSGKTRCVHCGALDVALDNGACEHCQATLATCDVCMIRPDRCHYAEGTCREPAWGESKCLTAHVVYLSNTSGVKIGITREDKIHDLSRWIDQGATQALPILRVDSRLTAGQIEAAITEIMADKTNWRTMLTGNGPALDLKAIAADVIAQFQDKLALYGDKILEVYATDVVQLDFPVQTFPIKVGNAWNVSKQPVFSGTLVGVKGQYIMVDVQGKIEVLKLRKYAGYDVTLCVQASE